MRSILAVTAAYCAFAAGAQGQEPIYETPPIVAPLGQRFLVVVLDQPDRDLLLASPRINMMFDTTTGRSWILEYSRKPGSNEQGYVWVEVPIAAPPRSAVP
jgi:hypothetical protein